ncbi:hypothetical protein ACIOD2_49815 [Amycolatopsis sp. NPDC088138]|uniref:hypothetical protein n=1 Tax=Amycolatopsis sp. NPDC088138 TaxID=3363938 RepID=UPI0037F82C5F
MTVPLSDVDRAVAILAAQGLGTVRAGAELREMARERHISLARCAALVVTSVDRAGR